jgi:hypothetical protein
MQNDRKLISAIATVQTCTDRLNECITHPPVFDGGRLQRDADAEPTARALHEWKGAMAHAIGLANHAPSITFNGDPIGRSLRVALRSIRATIGFPDVFGDHMAAITILRQSRDGLRIQFPAEELVKLEEMRLILLGSLGRGGKRSRRPTPSHPSAPQTVAPTHVARPTPAPS